jgi:predicted metal-dependent phosphoesterase TrpH
LVELAKRSHLEALAITDHDTVAGNVEALRAGTEFGLEVIPGVEISADSAAGTIHIVGLLIRPDDEEMESVLRELRLFREERNRKMIARLAELGVHVTFQELAMEAGGDLVGRPHFAALLTKKGYVKTYQEAFDIYLKSGGKAYLDKKRLPSDQAIAMIQAAGGLPILAHPYIVRDKIQDGFEKQLSGLVDQGLRGIEVFYTEHSRGDEAYFADLARRYNLLVSGGTDFHGAVKPDVSLGRGFGAMNIPYELLQHLKEALA